MPTKTQAAIQIFLRGEEQEIVNGELSGGLSDIVLPHDVLRKGIGRNPSWTLAAGQIRMCTLKQEYRTADLAKRHAVLAPWFPANLDANSELQLLHSSTLGYLDNTLHDCVWVRHVANGRDLAGLMKKEWLDIPTEVTMFETEMVEGQEGDDVAEEDKKGDDTVMENTQSSMGPPTEINSDEKWYQKELERWQRSDECEEYDISQ